jgi:spermidine synthase
MKDRPILQNKYYLYLTEFFSGVSVMAVELGASRLLAPYFSSSQIVWTIIIGTIMIAMALGNLYGGRSADSDPDPDILYRRILIAAVWISAIPALGKYVILGVSALLVFAVNTNFLIIAAFVSCMVIFVYPLFLLGTVTPSLVKYTVDSLDDSGRTVGVLNACNTIGSIIGTFLPTFVTIPAVGTSVTFLIFSGILLLIGLIYFISSKNICRIVVITLILFIIFSVFGRSDSFAFWEDDLLYEGESVYNYLQVREDDRETVLSTNVLFGVQSVKMKSAKLTGMYYDYALAAPVMAGPDQALDILVLGNGTGTFASQCLEYFPGSAVDAVEIDARITELAKIYFEMPDEVNVSEYDGRAWLMAADGKYDVVLVDAYQDITIPFQMSTREFFSLVRDHLRENGVMVVNMNMYSDGEGSINSYLTDTICSVFTDVCSADVPGTTNREVFACCSGDLPAMLSSHAGEVKDTALRVLMNRVSSSLKPCEGGDLILTDDRAPVELLGMKMIDLLIADEVSYYKALYEEEGLHGILVDFGIA